jgi:N-acetylneuraminate synthase
MNSYGETYGKHREYLEFNKDQHKQLQLWCNEYGVEYSSSVWDLTSARDIMELNPKTLKIPSACNLNFELLQLVSESFPGEIHLSFGMTTKEEEEKIKNGEAR